jgi:AraC-like DNA-binding protein
MSTIHERLREIHQVGRETREWIVGATTCPALKEHGMLLVGRSQATPGFVFSRIAPDMGQVLACVAGRGEARVDGQWRAVGPGHGYLTPPGVDHAYRATGRRWQLAWVIFSDRPGAPSASVRRPTIVRLDPQPLDAAIRELHRESIGPSDLSLMRQWTGLIHRIARRVCEPGDAGGRLVAVWEAVDADLARRWTLNELARLASISGEHFRRICHAEHAMSPMRRVTEMRLQRAAGLLISTPWSIEAVATAVGYANAFAFSTAFKRRHGVPPSSLRS